MCQIAIVQVEARILNVRILIYVIDTLGIQRRCPTLDAVNFVALF